MDFNLRVTKKDLARIKRMLIGSDAYEPTMTNADMIREAFYMEFGMYGELDLRNSIDLEAIGRDAPTGTSLQIQRDAAAHEYAKQELQRLNKEFHPEENH